MKVKDEIKGFDHNILLGPIDDVIRDLVVFNQAAIEMGWSEIELMEYTSYDYAQTEAWGMRDMTLEERTKEELKRAQEIEKQQKKIEMEKKKLEELKRKYE